eukprot:CAMPEP_0197904652 /NCGR_PEP_ID=MMETSP1439-20131203/58513_1 /TAXON_ID=66791 /ORGANISM="Gonyaulax spinifera, Strain CCMP409" /LENGTH=48 /DNA_ID= /DNA_START= /DNA_END= /DNA_ORIENTATION=
MPRPQPAWQQPPRVAAGLPSYVPLVVRGQHSGLQGGEPLAGNVEALRK